MTNYEKIKQMSIEEMAAELFIHQFGHCHSCKRNGKTCSGNYFNDKSCIFGVQEWLESEVEKNEIN